MTARPRLLSPLLAMEESKVQIDAGLKSLDHCMCLSTPSPTPKCGTELYGLLCVCRTWLTDNPVYAADQYKLPAWRYWVREKTLPLVRWETPYLAWLQERARRPSLDSWFAITANLGTHTFYMVMLPILFWCGYTNIGRPLVPHPSFSCERASVVELRNILVSQR